IGVRRLDLAIRGEPLGRVGAELGDLLEQDLGGAETADEELEVEALRRARLDRLEPGVERAAAGRGNRVELLVGPRRLRAAAPAPRRARPARSSRGRTA